MGRQGKFITIEGTEGVGKSTNLTLIADFIESKQIDLDVTREPGGTPFAEEIRELLLSHREEKVDDLAELLLMFAARAQHLHQRILPRIQQGFWVLSDRFTDATYAYQGGGRQLDISQINVLEKLVQKAFQPDLTFILDAPPEVGMARAQKRGALDRFETEKIAFFERVRSMYLKRAALNPPRYRIIDASKPLEEVQAAILAELEKVYDAWLNS